MDFQSLQILSVKFASGIILSCSEYFSKTVCVRPHCLGSVSRATSLASYHSNDLLYPLICLQTFGFQYLSQCVCVCMCMYVHVMEGRPL